LPSSTTTCPGRGHEDNPLLGVHPLTGRSCGVGTPAKKGRPGCVAPAASSGGSPPSSPLRCDCPWPCGRPWGRKKWRRRPAGPPPPAAASAPARVGVAVGQHAGPVDAGEGLVLGVLEEAGGADGQRAIHQADEGLQVGEQFLGKPGGEEAEATTSSPSFPGPPRAGGCAPGSGRRGRCR